MAERKISLYVMDILNAAINELKAEGIEPDIILVGPEFGKFLNESMLKMLKMKVYYIEELGSDAIVADSKYLGQLRKAAKRISIEPFLEEMEWEKILEELPEVKEELEEGD
ncbi:family 4B encapsulin nanocompartment shell protein [Pyrococcus abyssi]|uniref:DUF1884 domain-containing protein n=1 Tax=Pyrococcus abyssi (strain GE5 / Orsay) TaxID=272844 RepID=Q9V1P0_PYRAB|nr:family 4B encapsulin nanocompartment shell protein [Pyrococcus abyssi]CAB49309.1 Hypothetical protein PAB0258 [Pyrococcus abyssi GE5]CCE69765.1 TPA: hypothetical protein PAB0258 [Pyrococcus abyssi GE5]